MKQLNKTGTKKNLKHIGGVYSQQSSERSILRTLIQMTCCWQSTTVIWYRSSCYCTPVFYMSLIESSYLLIIHIAYKERVVEGHTLWWNNVLNAAEPVTSLFCEFKFDTIHCSLFYSFNLTAPSLAPVALFLPSLCHGMVLRFRCYSFASLDHDHLGLFSQCFGHSFIVFLNHFLLRFVWGHTSAHSSSTAQNKLICAYESIEAQECADYMMWYRET